MKESAQTIHTAHRDKNRHLNFFLLLLPSLAFVFVLALFLKNRFNPQAVATHSETRAMETLDITVKNAIVHVRVARTDAEHTQGLSGVQSLGENEGMLFVFPAKTQPPFWMKDMLIPLDFIWISDGVVTQIHKNVAPPLTGTPDNNLLLYIPKDKIDHVLEVNAGFADSHKIEVGDHVTIP